MIIDIQHGPATPLPSPLVLIWLKLLKNKQALGAYYKQELKLAVVAVSLGEQQGEGKLCSAVQNSWATPHFFAFFQDNGKWVHQSTETCANINV